MVPEGPGDGSQKHGGESRESGLSDQKSPGASGHFAGNKLPERAMGDHAAPGNPPYRVRVFEALSVWSSIVRLLLVEPAVVFKPGNVRRRHFIVKGNLCQRPHISVHGQAMPGLNLF